VDSLGRHAEKASGFLGANESQGVITAHHPTSLLTG
jgi:hypothetical protein